MFRCIKQIIILFYIAWYPGSLADSLPQSQNLPKSDVFEARSVRGVIYALPRLSTSWIRVRPGMTLKQGTLLQISSQASAKFSVAGEDTTTTLDIESLEPMALRLDHGMLRKIKVEEIKIEALPIDQDTADAIDTDILKLPRRLSAAWTHLQASLASKNLEGQLKRLDSKSKQELEQIALSKEKSSIPLYFPSDNSRYSVETIPTKVHVAWKENPDTEQSYIVYYWQRGATPKPVSTAFKVGKFDLLIRREGNYLVQIKSKDGKYASAIREFSVYAPARGPSENGEPSDSGALMTGSKAITGGMALSLLMPADRAFLLKEGTSTIQALPVLFTWAKLPALDSVGGFELSIARDQDSGEADVKTYRTTESFAEINLAPGRYAWWVRTWRYDLSKSLLALDSDKQTFTLRQGSGMSEALKAISKLGLGAGQASFDYTQ